MTKAQSKLKSYVMRLGPSSDDLDNHLRAYDEFFTVVMDRHMLVSEVLEYYGITNEQHDRRWVDKGWSMFFVHALDRQFREIRSWENQPEKYADIVLSLYGLARQHCDLATVAAIYGLEETEVERIHQATVAFLQEDEGRAVLILALRNAWNEAYTVPVRQQASTGTNVPEFEPRYQQLSEFLENIEAKSDFNPLSVVDARERVVRAIISRRGQSEFRTKLLETYEGHCTMTNCDAPDALEAAHIIPYRGTATNTVENGLLLRADIHTLFDLGLIAVDSATMCIVVAPRLLATQYGGLAGRRLSLPREQQNHPSCHALDIHRKTSGL